jgi:Na+/H+-dicarboxylate symporter
MISMGQSAAIFVILLLIMVASSNFIAITLGYSVGSTFLPNLELMLHDAKNSNILEPLWQFHAPKFASNEISIILGISLGLWFAFKPNTRAFHVASALNRYSNIALKKVFMPVLPLFLLGFVMKLEHEGVLARLFEVYGSVLFLIVGTQISYILILYCIAANGNIMKMWRYIRNILPAMFTGFASISSAATMPVTMLATERNMPHSPEFAKVIIPATANIHTVGSAIGLTIVTLATMLAFGHPLPSHTAFFTFAFYYTIAKFAVAGIPGGVVIVVTPLLEQYLGFSAEMVGLITAIYLLFDPFGTATNVTCNGAFALLFKKVYTKVNGNDITI